MRDSHPEELLAGLHFNLPLPRLRIPGMPNIVSVNNAHLVIVGRDVKGKGKVFAGVTGEVDVKVNAKKRPSVSASWPAIRASSGRPRSPANPRTRSRWRSSNPSP